jgi:hypothetical protein
MIGPANGRPAGGRPSPRRCEDRLFGAPTIGHNMRVTDSPPVNVFERESGAGGLNVDDRSNLASARKSGSGVPVHCWADGYELLA